MSLIAQFEAYLLTERRLAKNTFDAYRSDLAQVSAFLQERTLTLETATQDALKLFLASLKKQALSARSMARKISSLKVFYDYAERVAGLPNLGREILFPRIERVLPRFLTEAEIELLFKTLEQDSSLLGMRNKLMMHLLYASGMRITELTLLKVHDIHKETGFIAVQGKGNKQRLIPLPQQLFAAIDKYLTQLPARAEFLFSTVYAGKIKPISRQACWTILKKLCQSAGIKRSVSPHQLRHSLATHLLKRGADLRSLQMWLGHENLTTVQIYTHVDTNFLRTVYDKKHPRS